MSHKIHFGNTKQPLFPSLESHFSQVVISTHLFLFALCCISSLDKGAYGRKAKSPTSTLDEIHTGSLWEQATKMMWWWSRCISPSTGLLLWQTNTDEFWFTFICTIYLYTIILEQRLLQWWLKLHGVGLYPQSWIWKRKSKKTDSWDEITGWTQLSVINHQSNY